MEQECNLRFNDNTKHENGLINMLSEIEMEQAIAKRDKSADGRFVYGVVTTSIFCRPSCSSKPAKTENLRFFYEVEQAMLAGYRPCKRCCPAGRDEKMDCLIKVARYIENHGDEQMTLASLAEMFDLSSSTLQRKFKQAFGVSPKHYQDAVRMGHFKKSLKEGDGVTEAIFAAGFGSISRVYGEATRNIGMSPKAYKDGGTGEVIHYAVRQTQLGFMLMAATEKGVCFVQFADDETALLTQLQVEFPKAQLTLSLAKDSVELDHWIDALEQHIDQGAPRPELPLDIRGTVFQIQVWRFLLSIQDGSTVSYADVAVGIDKPKAVRAAASACGKNRIAVLIPCHRVLRGDGSLGGYRWGQERKKELLEKEKAITPIK